MTNRAKNIQALAAMQSDRRISFATTTWVLACQGVPAIDLPSDTTGGRSAVAYCSDGSVLEYSDADPLGTVR